MGYTLAKDIMYSPEELKQLLTPDEWDMLGIQSNIVAATAANKPASREDIAYGAFCLGFGFAWYMQQLRAQITKDTKFTERRANSNE